MDEYVKNDNFADYFVVCGLDLSSGLEPYRFFGEVNLQNTPLDRSYKCKVLHHFPNSVIWNPFDGDAICMMCLPNGLCFRTEKHVLGPTFHSFVITQQDGRQFYGLSYIFYERASRKICSAMQTLQSMHLTELSDGQKRKKNNYASNNNNTRSLPRHFKIMHHSSLGQSYYDLNKDTLYVTKSIALVSPLPYVYAAHQFLTTLYMLWKTQNSITLESYIYYILKEVTVPAAGCSLSFSLVPDKAIIIQRPNVTDELPLFDFPIQDVFSLIDVDCFIYIFTCLLLENQILICSPDYQQLMLVAETITCLLFPFVWPHVYVPILPTSLEHFLDAPVPFVMGLTKADNCSNICSEANLCFVDLTARTIQVSEDLPTIPYKSDFILEVTNLLKTYNLPMCTNFRHVKSSESNFRTDLNKELFSKSSENLGTLSDDTNKPSHHLRTSLLKNKMSKQSDADGQRLACNTVYSEGYSIDNDAYIRNQCFNVAIRELFLNKFLHIFETFDRFIIQPNQNQEQWISKRERIHSFDKSSFLSDQPQQYLPFLSQFIETQMFTNFVDNKIQTSSAKLKLNLNIFECRLQLLRKRHNEDTYQCCSLKYCSMMEHFVYVVKIRLSEPDVIIALPREIFTTESKPKYSLDVFPTLNFSVLEEESVLRKVKKVLSRQSSGVTNNHTICEVGPIKICSEAHPLGHSEKLTIAQSATSEPMESEVGPSVIAHTNWNFVDQLLKDCKTRIKKMLVSKIGYEAAELGVSMRSIIVEENTLIVGLCDLLERIWSHGCQSKQGKSALWNHLQKYKEIVISNGNANKTRNLAMQRSSRTVLRSNSVTRVNGSSFVPFESENEFAFQKLSTLLIQDMKYVQSMIDIKTTVGCAKAWIRLSIEKKLLSQHLRSLLSNETLVKDLYKRYAFLRCEDERDQFLYHLLTLNAVEYHCFTNTYINACFLYKVVIHTKVTIATMPTIWIALAGSLGETKKIFVPNEKLDFTFHSKNLGMLTLLRIGQDSSDSSHRYFIDHLTVQNEVTGHVYNFCCGRWLGRGIDDDSLERLLIGKRVIDSTAGRSRHMSASRKKGATNYVSESQRLLLHTDIQQNLSDCVNNMIKYFYGTSKENISCIAFLCDENGLVQNLQRVFMYGFKSTRLFGHNLYLWDFIVKVREETEISHVKNTSEIAKYFCDITDRIQSSSFGKDGRFQLFICLTIRDRKLTHILSGVMAPCKSVVEMYEDYSFLRKKPFLNFVLHLLESVNEFDIKLDPFFNSKLS